MIVDAAAVGHRSTAIGAKAGEVVGVQYLRAIAAILVVLHHARDQFPILSRVIPTHAMQGGVDMFFVISGFIMVHTTTRPGYGRWEFWERRLTRIVPLYWVMTAFTAFLLIFFPSLPRDSKFTLSDLITSLFFIPHYSAGKPDEIVPMLSLGWTLNYEMFFYLVFGLLIFLRPVNRTAAIAALFATLVCAVGLFQPSFSPLKFWGNPIVLEFVFGCAIACLAIKSVTSRIAPALAVALIATGTVAFFWFGSGNTNDWHRVVNLGLACAAIVFGVVSFNERGAFNSQDGVSRTMKELGDASYSIYLAHLFPVLAFRVFWQKAHLPIDSAFWAILFFAVCTSVGVGAGWATYRLVELRLKNLTRAAIGLAG